jgi:hypothetical protein
MKSSGISVSGVRPEELKCVSVLLYMIPVILVSFKNFGFVFVFLSFNLKPEHTYTLFMVKISWLECQCNQQYDSCKKKLMFMPELSCIFLHTNLIRLNKNGF